LRSSAGSPACKLRVAPAPGRLLRGYPAVAPVLLVAMVLVATGTVLAQQATQENSENESNSIHGTVINATTREPVARALVHSSDNRYATMTDDAGRFEFTLPDPAETNAQGQVIRRISQLTLSARKPGFLDDRSQGKWTQASTVAETTIALTPEALIKGKVTLPSGETARGVNVQLYRRQVQQGSPRWSLANSVQANSNGEFRFAELTPGTYRLFNAEWMDNDPITFVAGSQAYGYPPVYYPNAADFASSSQIHLSAGQIYDADLSLVRQAYYPVKIPVTNIDENGGLNITVSPLGERGPGYSLGYNRTKTMIEGQLPDGKYLVEGVTYSALPGGRSLSSSGSVSISVAGAAAEGTSMVLSRGNSIVINVHEEFASTTSPDSSGTSRNTAQLFALHGPRSEVSVSAETMDEFGAQQGGSIRPPMGPDDDSLVLENLIPGKYWLRVSPQRGYVASATMAGADLLREPMIVVPGASQQVDITLRDDSAELEGTLDMPAASGESPSERAYIYCIPLPDSTGQFLYFSEYDDGKFRSLRVTPGAYRVIAFDSKQPEIPYRDAEAMKAYESKGQVVHFSPGEKVTLKLQPIQGVE